MANTWTADSTQVTADTGTYTADGGTAQTPTTISTTVPTLAGYLLFLQNVVGVPAAILGSGQSTPVTDSAGNPIYDSSGNPVTSSGSANTQLMMTAQTTLNVALEIVNELINCASPTLYTYAVYNLASDRLINYAQDQNGQTFFADTRTALRIFSPALGVPTAASDQGTSVGLLNPEFMRLFTLRDLQTLKTPFGRAYMEIAMDYGSNLWGLS